MINSKIFCFVLILLFSFKSFSNSWITERGKYDVYAETYSNLKITNFAKSQFQKHQNLIERARKISSEISILSNNPNEDLSFQEIHKIILEKKNILAFLENQIYENIYISDYLNKGSYFRIEYGFDDNFSYGSSFSYYKIQDYKKSKRLCNDFSLFSKILLLNKIKHQSTLEFGFDFLNSKVSYIPYIGWNYAFSRKFKKRKLVSEIKFKISHDKHNFIIKPSYSLDINQLIYLKKDFSINIGKYIVYRKSMPLAYRVFSREKLSFYKEINHNYWGLDNITLNISFYSDYIGKKRIRFNDGISLGISFRI